MPILSSSRVRGLEVRESRMRERLIAERLVLLVIGWGKVEGANAVHIGDKRSKITDWRIFNL